MAVHLHFLEEGEHVDLDVEDVSGSGESNPADVSAGGIRGRCAWGGRKRGAPTAAHHALFRQDRIVDFGFFEDEGSTTTGRPHASPSVA
jgi:hypothetical protein